MARFFFHSEELELVMIFSSFSIKQISLINFFFSSFALFYDDDIDDMRGFIVANQMTFVSLSFARRGLSNVQKENRILSFKHFKVILN